MIESWILALAALGGAADGTKFGNTLRWKVTDGADVYGYNVMRGVGDSGPFLRLNRQIVRNSIGGEFSYHDAAVENDVSYYYFIEAVGEDGRKKQISPVVAKPGAAAR